MLLLRKYGGATKKLIRSNFKLTYKQDPLFLNLHKKLPELIL